jgi:hypothetical protein
MYASGCSMLGQPWRPEGLFEEALAIPGIGRWPSDLARVQLVYGERLRRAQATTESRLPAQRGLGDFTADGCGRSRNSPGLS